MQILKNKPRKRRLADFDEFQEVATFIVDRFTVAELSGLICDSVTDLIHVTTQRFDRRELDDLLFCVTNFFACVIPELIRVDDRKETIKYVSDALHDYALSCGSSITLIEKLLVEGHVSSDRWDGLSDYAKDDNEYYLLHCAFEEIGRIIKERQINSHEASNN